MIRPVLFALLVALPTAFAVEDFDLPLEPFFEQHCYNCHDDASAKGGLDLFSLDRDLHNEAAQAKWVRIYDRVMRGEMPPEQKSQPTRDEKVAFSKQLAPSLAAAHAEHKGTVLRRLNRNEYENTLNDLFGTRARVAELLPEDARSHEFDNVGEALSISVVQMQRYLDAAQIVLDEAIARDTSKPESKTVTSSYLDTRDAKTHLGKSWLQVGDAVVFFQRKNYPTGMLRDARVSQRGRYKIRVTGYAYQSDTPITMSIGAGTYQRGQPSLTFDYVPVAPGKPQTIEIETWIEGNYMIQLEPEEIGDFRHEIRANGLENYQGPGLAIQKVEVEGPLIEEWPSRGHRLIFDGIERREKEPSNPDQKTKSWYRPTFEIVSSNPRQDAETVLQRIASAAFRRPVEGSELGSYLELFEAELAKDSDFESALRTSITAILCAPDFLYLREKPGFLNHHGLAARLSYFLTRSHPDASLRSTNLARDPKALVSETRRLMADDRFERFITDFTDAWLDLRNIEFTSPDRNLFPEYDPYLQDSMLKETRAFWSELIARNLPVSNLAKSDFAMLNSRLAEHYQIPGVAGPEIRRVSLPTGSPRGGFLSQGSILKVSANGTNTSPVVRGVWVLERLLGRIPPPPPPGIAGVEPDIRGAETLRELLDQHRDSQSCQACHEMIDPPGFALESFNPIGGWRDKFRTLGEGERVLLKGDQRARYKLGLEVDSSGNFADGREFSGFLEFRDHLAEDEDVLARALTTKLLTFATGREMGFSDRPEINQIVKQSAEQGYGIRDLFELIVTSEIFRTK